MHDGEEKARHKPRAECSIYRKCLALKDFTRVKGLPDIRLLPFNALYRVLVRRATQDTLEDKLGLTNEDFSLSLALDVLFEVSE